VIRIAHVVDVTGPNPWLNGMADHCDRARFQHLVISLGPRSGLHDALEARGVATYALDARPRPRWPLAIARLTRLFRREKVDVVQTHLHNPSVVGIPAAKLARVPLTILTRHYADLTTLTRKPIHREIDRAQALVADKVWAISQFTRRCIVELERVPAERIDVLYYGFDFELMRPRLVPERRRELRASMGGDEALLIGMVARLSVEKEHEVALEAMRTIRAHHPRARLVLVGDGPRRAELEAMAARLGVGDAVRFLGQRSDAWDVIEAMDLVVHPGAHEAFGIVYVEAMALERAVVTVDGAAAPEIIDDGQTGAIVPPRDPAALAAAVAALLDNPSRARAMGQEARRRVVERYTYPKVMQTYERAYTNWLGAG
jgi:glycosyltransferase involved in cell wall biosynthesis